MMVFKDSREINRKREKMALLSFSVDLYANTTTFSEIGPFLRLRS